MAGRKLEPFILDETAKQIVVELQSLVTEKDTATQSIVTALNEIAAQLTALNETLKTKDTITDGDVTS